MKRIIITWLLLCALGGVIFRGGDADACSGTTRYLGVAEQSVCQNKRTFTFPDIPSSLRTPAERLNFLVHHYWDKFDFTDTTYIELPEVTEQALVNYMDLLQRVPVEVADSCMELMLKAASKELSMLEYLTETLHQYCFDIYSPTRNEEAYLPVAKFLLHSPLVDEVTRLQAEYDLKNIALNRKGTVANDFEYTLASGKQGSMHQLTKDFTLLVFYNPDCKLCEEQLEYMKESPLFMGHEFLSHVDVLAFYVDEEYDLWKKKQYMIPKEWINGYDAKGIVIRKGVYHIDVTPSIYLLDKDKRVLLKDVSVKEIEEYFSQVSW